MKLKSLAVLFFVTFFFAVTFLQAGIVKLVGLSYSSEFEIFSVGGKIQNLTPSLQQGKARSFSISPALPKGLIFNVITGVISGRPEEEVSTAIFTITARNTVNQVKKTITLTVTGINKICINENEGITLIDLQNPNSRGFIPLGHSSLERQIEYGAYGNGLFAIPSEEELSILFIDAKTSQIKKELTFGTGAPVSKIYFYQDLFITEVENKLIFIDGENLEIVKIIEEEHVDEITFGKNFLAYKCGLSKVKIISLEDYSLIKELSVQEQIRAVVYGQGFLLIQESEYVGEKTNFHIFDELFEQKKTISLKSFHGEIVHTPFGFVFIQNRNFLEKELVILDPFELELIKRSLSGSSFTPVVHAYGLIIVGETDNNSVFIIRSNGTSERISLTRAPRFIEVGHQTLIIGYGRESDILSLVSLSDFQKRDISVNLRSKEILFSHNATSQFYIHNKQGADMVVAPRKGFSIRDFCNTGIEKSSSIIEVGKTHKLAINSTKNTVELWSLQTNAKELLYIFSSSYNGSSFTDGQYFVVCLDQKILLIDSLSLTTEEISIPEDIFDIFFGPNFFVVTTYIWNLEIGKTYAFFLDGRKDVQQIFSKSYSIISFVSFKEDHIVVVGIDFDRHPKVSFFNYNFELVHQIFLEKGHKKLGALYYHPYLIIGQSNQLSFIDSNTFQICKTINLHSEIDRIVAFGNNRILVKHKNNFLSLVDKNTGEVLQEIFTKDFSNAVYSQNYFVLLTSNQKILLIDAITGKFRSEIYIPHTFLEKIFPFHLRRK